MVEDNQTAMMQIRTVLESEGYLVDTAGGGQEAIDYVKDTIPDGIILDLMMPKMDGFTVVGKVKEDKKTNHIPVIALTARAMKGDREKIIEAGCDDYISKPIEPEDVLKKIGEWLEK